MDVYGRGSRYGVYPATQISVRFDSICTWFIGGIFVYRVSCVRTARFAAQLWPVSLAIIFTVNALLWTDGSGSIGRNVGQLITCGVFIFVLPMFKELASSVATRVAHVIAKYSYSDYSLVLLHLSEGPCTMAGYDRTHDCRALAGVSLY
jgi:hypothetical protein